MNRQVLLGIARAALPPSILLVGATLLTTPAAAQKPRWPDKDGCYSPKDPKTGGCALEPLPPSRIDPADPEVAAKKQRAGAEFSQGVRAETANDLQTARSLFQQAVDDDPENTEYSGRLAALNVRMMPSRAIPAAPGLRVKVPNPQRSEAVRLGAALNLRVNLSDPQNEPVARDLERIQKALDFSHPKDQERHPDPAALKQAVEDLNEHLAERQQPPVTQDQVQRKSYELSITTDAPSKKL